jgi:hypothetical protein
VETVQELAAGVCAKEGGSTYTNDWREDGNALAGISLLSFQKTSLHESYGISFSDIFRKSKETCDLLQKKKQ